MSGITIAQIVIDDSSDKTITGVWVFDRSLGGTLAIPAVSSFPSPAEPGEIVWRTDLNRIYRRNDANTAWEVAAADISFPGQEQGSIVYFDGTNWVQLPPGTDGYVLTTHGTGANPSWAIAGTGNGDVVGPAASTDNAITRFDGTTGKLIQNSVITLSDTGGLSGVNEINFNLRSGASVPYAEGKIFYDQDEHTLTMYNDVNGISLNMGQELYIRVSNISGSTILNGSVVFINGAQGNRPTVGLASSAANSTDNVIGVATHDIPNNTIGYITTYGLVHDLNTNSYSDGDALYVGTTPGSLTNIKPTGTNYIVQIATVTRQHPTQGIILVNVKTTGHLADLHDVRDGYPYDGYYLKGDGYFWTGSSLSSDVLSILPPGGAPLDVTKSSALAGTSNSWSRSDHKHDISTASASSLTVGGSNSEGSATSLARSDHTHALPAFGSTAGTFTQGNDSRLSDDRTASGLRTSTTVVSISGATAPTSGQALVATSSTLANWQSVPTTSVTITAGAGLTGGGDLSANRTINVGANVDGSITVNADDIQVGILATDTQHGNRGGGSLHAAVSNIENGFVPSVGSSGTIFNSTGTAGQWSTSSSLGLVSGPASATDRAISIYNGTTGKIIQNTGVTITAGNIISGVTDPVASSDVATKNYVDTTASIASNWKQAVKVVSTSNITLSGAQTIDGVSVVATDRVLVAGQTTASQNGIYICAAGAWSRSTDATTASQIQDLVVTIQSGTVNADTVWKCTTDGAITVGTTSLSFSPLAISTIAPANIDKSSSVIGVSSYYARADHKHDITTASAVSLTGSSTSTEGTATSLARSDHTHSIVGLLTSTAPTTISVTTASAGAATSAARQDHVHDVSTAGPTTLSVGGSNITGTATSLARSDHVHALPAFGTTAGTFAQGNDSRLSDDRTASGLRTSTTVVSISGATAPTSGQSLVASSGTAATWQSVALASTTITAGAGLTGGGDLSANRTINIGANVDGSIVVNADDIQVGILATDAQHGNRGGGSLHSAVSNTANGFVPSVGASGTIFNSTGTAGQWSTSSTLGLVSGPGSATDRAIAIYSGTTGKIIQNTGVTITAGNIISGVTDPSSAQDVATKNYVDSAISGNSNWKQAVKAATTANITLSGTQTIDGISIVATDRVLVKNQSTTSQNGIYICSAGAWIRASDATTASQIQDMIVPIQQGTVNADSVWKCVTDPTITVGSTSLVFSVLGIDSTSPSNVSKSAASTGTSSYYARIDHKHDINTAAAVSLTSASTNTEGIATTLARSDHTHSIPKRIVSVEYVMAEDVNNTTKYFYTWKSSSSLADVERSGANSGLQNSNSCSPYQVPFNGNIVKATLTVRGVGVQNGSVTYPVSFQTTLFDIGFTAESSLANVNFSISNSFTVGTFSVAATNFKGSTALSIAVTEGQMLGLKFINGTGASLAGQMRNAFVSLVIEET